jgi:hypothetical protein
MVQEARADATYHTEASFPRSFPFPPFLSLLARDNLNEAATRPLQIATRGSVPLVSAPRCSCPRAACVMQHDVQAGKNKYRRLYNHTGHTSTKDPAVERSTTHALLHASGDPSGSVLCRAVALMFRVVRTLSKHMRHYMRVKRFRLLAQFARPVCAAVAYAYAYTCGKAACKARASGGGTTIKKRGSLVRPLWIFFAHVALVSPGCKGRWRA